MPVIGSISPLDLAQYARVPIYFRVANIYRVESIDGGLGGLRMLERAVPEPYLKDYDALEGGSPITWPAQFDISNWGLFLAMEGEQPVGAAAVAWNTDGVHMLEGRADMAVLWDIRVALDWRGRGVGRALFQHAAAWARERGCRRLKIETQNINAEACRFYARMGCELGAIRKYAYLEPGLEDEVMLLWYLSLA